MPGAVNTKKTVSIVYHVRRGVLAYADHDELYWNATGTEWTVPIASAEVYVTLPGGVSDADVRTAGFTGPLGAVGRDYAIDRIEGYWRFKTTRALRPREGVTVLVDWPSGHIAHPSELRRLGWVFSDYWPLALPVLALIWGGFVWSAFDAIRGEALGEASTRRGGPDSGAGGRALDERAHTRDVVATIVDLAVRGYRRSTDHTAFAPGLHVQAAEGVGGDPI